MKALTELRKEMRQSSRNLPQYGITTIPRNNEKKILEKKEKIPEASMYQPLQVGVAAQQKYLSSRDASIAPNSTKQEEAQRNK